VFAAVKQQNPSAECFIVEPEGSNKMARSLQAGVPLRNEREASTIMDALSGRVVGEKTFSLLKHQDVRAVAVSDREASDGVVTAFRHLRLVLEAGGAAALGALVARRIVLPNKRIVVIGSGGNVDSAAFAAMLAAAGR
jgi:threonine dehydratase